MSDQTLTLVITEPTPLPSGGLMTRIVTLDEHGCEVSWYALDTAGHGYGPMAEHPDRDLFGWPAGIGLGFAFSNGVEEGWAVPSFEAGVEAAVYETAERIDAGWDFDGNCARPDEPPFPPNTVREPDDAYIDGGWEDADGFPIPETTSPSCDRTCLSCQGGDHTACGMGCHDEELNDHAAGEHEAVPVATCGGCMDDAADEDALLAHEAAHEAGSATLVRRNDCPDCDEPAARTRPEMSSSAPAGDRPAPRSASVELHHLGDRFVAYRVVVLVADEFGFVEERHVWNGCSRDEGERAAEIACKALGAVNGLTVVSR